MTEHHRNSSLFRQTPGPKLPPRYYAAFQGNIIGHIKYVKMKFCFISEDGLPNSKRRKMQNLHGKEVNYYTDGHTGIQILLKAK